MKKIIISSSLIAMSLNVCAGVALPTNTGIDGWNADSRSAQSGAFQQGYLTLSNSQNPLINPAHAAKLKNSTQVNLNGSDQQTALNHDAIMFGGGVFADVKGHTIGAYVGRPTEDAEFYQYDEQGVGLLSGYLDFYRTDPTTTDQATVPFNIIDLFWAKQFSFGDMGLRFNYRALNHQDNEDLSDNNVTENQKIGKAYEYNFTTGLVAKNMPFEVTASVGIPILDITDNVQTNTPDLQKKTYDKALRLSSTIKYKVISNEAQQLQVGAYIASNKANIKHNETDQSDNIERTYFNQHLGYGLTLSYAKQYNASTRLVASTSYDYANRQIGRQQIYLGDISALGISQNNRVAFAAGLEFKRSPKTTLIGSVSTNVYDKFKYEISSGDTDDQQPQSNYSDGGLAPNPTVELGFKHKFTDKVVLDFVLNKDLIESGIDEGLASYATITYLF